MLKTQLLCSVDASAIGHEPSKASKALQYPYIPSTQPQNVTTSLGSTFPRIIESSVHLMARNGTMALREMVPSEVPGFRAALGGPLVKVEVTAGPAEHGHDTRNDARHDALRVCHLTQLISRTGSEARD